MSISACSSRRYVGHTAHPVQSMDTIRQHFLTFLQINPCFSALMILIGVEEFKEDRFMISTSGDTAWICV